jgi:hypothetical protein
MFCLKELEHLSSGIYLDHENINSLLWVFTYKFFIS